jgi:zinc/manganese transport system substrate-binding protein
MLRYFRVLSLLSLLCISTQSGAQALNIVAAENFYGDLAQQLGGHHVNVTSILSNPDQDPHMFETSVATAKSLSHARLVIYNGIDYDPWMATLLSAAKASGRKTLVVGDLLHKKTGDNPHLWYQPDSMPVLARAISAELQLADPANKGDYQARLQQVLASLQPLNRRIGVLRQRYAGTAVTATEPVFGYMADALGFKMRNARFQLAVMNNTEPSASDIAAFENDLKTRQVRVLFYNSQASDPSAKRVRDVAQQAHIPVIGVTETEPPGKHYQDWMMGQLDQVEQALSHK